jgi:hypothetical protein
MTDDEQVNRLRKAFADKRAPDVPPLLFDVSLAYLYADAVIQVVGGQSDTKVAAAKEIVLLMLLLGYQTNRDWEYDLREARIRLAAHGRT